MCRWEEGMLPYQQRHRESNQLESRFRNQAPSIPQVNRIRTPAQTHMLLLHQVYRLGENIHECILRDASKLSKALSPSSKRPRGSTKVTGCKDH